MTSSQGSKKWHSIAESIRRPFVSTITATSSDFGNMAVIGDSDSLKDYFIKQVVKTDLIPSRNLIPEYDASIEQKINEKTAGSTKLKARATQSAPHAGEELNSTRRVSRLKSMFKRSSTETGVLSFKVFDIDSSYRKKASITYKATITNADVILYFTQENKDDDKIRKWIKEIVSLRKSDDVPLILVSDKGIFVKELCSEHRNVYLSDLTTLKLVMKESEERNALCIERLNTVLFNSMAECLRKKNEKDQSDLIFYGD